MATIPTRTLAPDPARPRASVRGASAIAAVAWIALAAAADAEADRGRLFRIEHPGRPASHVFGTLHSDDARVATLDPRVEAALAASRSAAFETLLGDGDLQAFFEQAQYPDGRRLTDHVDAATLAAIREALGAQAPDADTLARTKPWGVLLRLAQPRGASGHSLDDVLQDAARRRRLPVFGLELPEEQVASLDAVPLASQLALMRWALATHALRAADLEATTQAWLAGDLARLRALAVAPGVRDAALAPHFAALMRHLIANRNALFAHRLYLPLRSGRVFVAVGALHLDGDDGLLALLRRQGYRVTRVLRRRRPQRLRARIAASMHPRRLSSISRPAEARTTTRRMASRAAEARARPHPAETASRPRGPGALRPARPAR